MKRGYEHIHPFQSPAIEFKGNFEILVAIDGNIIVIGEQQGDPSGIANAGKTYF
jgi:hypothetical protein